MYRWLAGWAAAVLMVGCTSADGPSGGEDASGEAGVVTDGTMGGAGGVAGQGGEGGTGGIGGEGGVGGVQPCTDGVEEACEINDCQGTHRCEAGAWTACEGPAELCNGVDDNCDGQVDELWAGLGEACEAGVVPCVVTGILACTADGADTVCVGAEPVGEAEVCNGLDDDCDGLIDEELGQAPCETDQLGACATGMTRCQLGVVACVATHMPADEQCNGLDDDCDGVADNGDPGGGAACETDQAGVCAAGVLHCAEGAVVCVANMQPVPEVCDALDNNCDGAADNVAGLGDACTVGQGACAVDGTLICGAAPAPVCDALAGMPTPEVCDEIDNDCDGVVDNDTCAHNDDMVAGVQQRVLESDVLTRGWQRCYTSRYNVSGDALAQIRADCAGSQLLMACRPVGADRFSLAAEGRTSEVLFDVGDGRDASHAHNGVAWYFNGVSSWGFAPEGSAVQRASCDGGGELGALRMCWHTRNDAISAGYRCGDNQLNGSADWERVVYRRRFVRVGSYTIGDGPRYTQAESLSCAEACSEVFGGTGWGCSTAARTMNHRAHGDMWGNGDYCSAEDVDDGYVLPANRDYDCGVEGCSFSAYVADHCRGGETNTCWRATPLSFADVRQEVPVAELVGGGFERCWATPYMAPILPIEAVRNACTGDVLLMGCGAVGAPTLRLGAMGLRAEVFRDVGDAANASHSHNNVTWYFSENRSWGFAPSGAAVRRSSCDLEADQSNLRMCWHTAEGNVRPGWSCGDTRNGVNDERVIYQRAGGL